MIFLDTSAIYALADAGDPLHAAAIERFQEILDRREEMFTHNYVLLESISLLQARLGVSAAAKFANESAAFQVEWVDKGSARFRDARVAKIRKATHQSR